MTQPYLPLVLALPGCTVSCTHWFELGSFENEIIMHAEMQLIPNYSREGQEVIAVSYASLSELRGVYPGERLIALGH